MDLIIVSWFVLGWLVGIATTAIACLAAAGIMDKIDKNEEFVKKLVKEKGWIEARWELEFSFNGKYLRTWRRLYQKHIEGEDKDE